jgi:hypothetical protein
MVRIIQNERSACQTNSEWTDEDSLTHSVRYIKIVEENGGTINFEFYKKGYILYLSKQIPNILPQYSSIYSCFFASLFYDDRLGT